MKKLFTFACAVMLTLTLTISAHAVFAPVIDLYDDANTITAVWSQDNTIWVEEDYNDYSRLIPFPSHDGYAIVNSQGQFFDKQVMGPFPISAPLILNFKVLNTTPYKWSDYHFLVIGGPMILSGESDVFTQQSYTGTQLGFYAPGWVEQGQTVNFSLTINPYGVNQFIIQQVATTVPIPGTLLLFAPGLLGMWAAVRRRSSK